MPIVVSNPAFADCRGVWSKPCSGGYSSGGSSWSKPELYMPDYDEYYRSYLGSAQNALAAGNLDGAQGWAEKALAERPGDPSAQALLEQIRGLRARQTALQFNNEGLRLFGERRFAEAAEAFRQALQYSPTDVQIQRNQQEAMAQLSLGDEYSHAWAATRAAIQAKDAALRDGMSKIDRDGRQLVAASAKKAVQVLADGCDGLACITAKIARIQGVAAAGPVTIETAKSEASIPWSDKANAVIVVGQNADGSRNTAPQRPLDGPAKVLKQEIDQLWNDVRVLDGQIAAEKDGMKLAVLVQQQSDKRSQVRVKEIAFVTFISRYAPDASAPAQSPAPASAPTPTDKK